LSNKGRGVYGFANVRERVAGQKWGIKDAFRIPRREVLKHASAGGSDEDEDHLRSADWRAFRAQLVNHERRRDSSWETAPESIPLATKALIDTCSEEKAANVPRGESGATWAFDAGDSVEQGTIMLHYPPEEPLQNVMCSLHHQYLHKSVVLLLQYVDCGSGSPPVQGVLLNRPTNLQLPTPRGAGGEWNVWYGGEDHGLHSPDPKLYCLHSLGHIPEAVILSRQVIPGIYFATIQNAHELVYAGHATPSDFWTFAGIVQWPNPQALLDELHSKMWRSVSTDSETIRKGLRILTAGAGVDPRYSGSRTWSMLRTMIGSPSYGPPKPRFDDRMFQQWALRNLVFDSIPDAFVVRDFDETDELMDELRTAKQAYHLDTTEGHMYEVLDYDDNVRDSLVGRLIRASSNHPFLLDNQEFHKSIVLILQDNDDLSVGLILNQPSPKSLELEFIHDKAFFQRRVFRIPLRYGGPLEMVSYDEDEDEHEASQTNPDNEDDFAIQLLHMSQRMRIAGIGEPVSYELGLDQYIWKCTADEAKFAIAQQLAVPSDFMAIRGLCLWPEGGIHAEIDSGIYELVPQTLVGQVWKTLLRQFRLTLSTMDENIDLADAAWNFACRTRRKDPKSVSQEQDEDWEEVDNLCTEAHRTWVMTYLLDDDDHETSVLP